MTTKIGNPGIEALADPTRRAPTPRGYPVRLDSSELFPDSIVKFHESACLSTTGCKACQRCVHPSHFGPDAAQAELDDPLNPQSFTLRNFFVSHNPAEVCRKIVGCSLQIPLVML